MRTTRTRCSCSLPKARAAWAGIALAAWVACAPGPEPPGGAASAAQVSAALKSFEEAWEREDLETAGAAFTPDGVVFDPVPPGRFEGSQAIRGWIAGSFAVLEGISIDISQVRVRTSGPVAWATAHYVFDARQAGAPARVEGDMTTVWMVQPDGSHRMAVFHASHLPVAAGG